MGLGHCQPPPASSSRSCPGNPELAARAERPRLGCSLLIFTLPRAALGVNGVLGTSPSSSLSGQGYVFMGTSWFSPCHMLQHLFHGLHRPRGLWLVSGAACSPWLTALTPLPG